MISQRWDSDFHESIKDLSNQVGLSVTDLTIEGLKIMLAMKDHPDFFTMSSDDRIQAVEGVYGQPSSISQSRNRENAQPGLVSDRIRKYLKQYHGKLLSTTQIASDLEIPRSTVRRAVQELDEEVEFTVISGRPNFVGYKVTST